MFKRWFIPLGLLGAAGWFLGRKSQSLTSLDYTFQNFRVHSLNGIRSVSVKVDLVFTNPSPEAHTINKLFLQLYHGDRALGSVSNTKGAQIAPYGRTSVPLDWEIPLTALASIPVSELAAGAIKGIRAKGAVEPFNLPAIYIDKVQDVTVPSGVAATVRLFMGKGSK